MPRAPNSTPLLAQAVGVILQRDLGTLRREIEAYPEEGDLWREVPGISNVGGTLALHLTGNIQHYLGHHLGKSEYRRNRPAEFGRRQVPRSELLREVDAAQASVAAALANLTEPVVNQEFPEVITGARVVTGEYLVHLATHFAYHLGQLDYHRRVVTGQATAVDAMRPADLSSARPVPTQ
jgi:DinB family protein